MKIDHFKIISKINGGLNNNLYVVNNLRDNRHYVLKIYKDNNRDRFKREISFLKYSQKYKIKFVPQIYNRKFPILNWSVCEDLFFSYNVSKKYKLLLSSKSKAKIILKKTKITINESFYNGFLHAKILHSFVLQNKNFSVFLFYYAIFSSSILGITINLFKLNFVNVFRFVGRFIGSFFMYSKKEIS